MKTLLTKEIVENINIPPTGRIEITRTRKSNGYSSIRLSFNADEEAEQTLAFSTYSYGDMYEQYAFAVADALRKIAENPCTIKEKEE